MIFDAKLAHILSDFFLDIAKAYFVGAFITPSLAGINNPVDIVLTLTKGLLNVILFLLASWQLSKLEEKL